MASHRLPSGSTSYRFNVESGKSYSFVISPRSEPAAKDVFARRRRQHRRGDRRRLAGRSRSRGTIAATRLSLKQTTRRTVGAVAIAGQNSHIPGHAPDPPIIVGISGASGAIYGVRLLEALHDKKIPAHLIVSKSAALTLKEETDVSIDHVRALAQTTYQNTDIGAAISSGSFRTRGMVIAPCSIRTLSDIAYGTTDSLLSRAADVTLKERRRLVLVVREAPLHAGHLRSMLAATENGAVIVPPVPAFYHRPKTIDDIVNQTVGRCLDLFDIDVGLVKRWRTRERRVVPPCREPSSRFWSFSLTVYGDSAVFRRSASIFRIGTASTSICCCSAPMSAAFMAPSSAR